MDFNQKDLEQIKTLGKAPAEVEEQLERFKTGFPDLTLLENVSEGNGLKKLNADELNKYTALYEESVKHIESVKFVPASGAASRMFKLLFNYLEGSVSFDSAEIQEYYNRLKEFAFADELLAEFGDEAETMIQSGDKALVENLLTEKGLNYGFLPKALLSFHKYEDGSITKAIDEHLVEGARYSADKNGIVRLHFTVSTDHISLIQSHLDKVVSGYETKFGVSYEISFSVQDKATDTLAVDMDNNPFRLEDGSLLFRPGGHGALLQNLDAINADLVFIKNIDNVAAQWLIEDTIQYKKALAGVLVETQQQIFDYCKQLKASATISADLETEIIAFFNEKLGLKLADDFTSKSAADKKAYLFSKLNRPVRICGVVQASNTGGGPFWVKESDGSVTLQLVETAQINLSDETQKTILQSSNYANITDLMCGVKDFEGNKFELLDYRDPNTGFIAEKSQGGKTLKAMELPGLWNGAMSNWNTMFVQVPITTFNPVKTVLDLLKKEHQGVQ